jgi:MotA/TolQ/ExbB proton channel family
MDVSSLLLERPKHSDPNRPAGRGAAGSFLPGEPAARDSFTYLLTLRFAVVNLVGVAFLGAAYLQGWIAMVMAGDPTFQCVGIFLVFTTGLVICTNRIWRLSWELNQARAVVPALNSRAGEYLGLITGRGGESRTIAGSMLHAKMADRLGTVRQIASSLVMLGLLGTVIGFIMSLSGVRPDVASDVKAVTPMIASMITGMSVALYTTLVGAVLNLWLMANYRLLESGTVRLVTTIVERGETENAG